MTEYRLVSFTGAGFTIELVPHWLHPDDEKEGKLHAWRIELSLGGKAKLYLTSYTDNWPEGFISFWESHRDSACLWKQVDQEPARKVLQKIYDAWCKDTYLEPTAEKAE